LLCLLGLVGLRVSEVTAAAVSDLEYERGKVRGHRTLTVTRKPLR
jgi:integrase